MYAKINNGVVEKYPFTQSDLQAQYPEASVPSIWTPEFMLSENIVTVVMTGKPEYDSVTQDVKEGAPVFSTTRQRWEQSWAVSVLSSQDATAMLAALKAAKNAEINAARLAANFSTFPHAGKAIACDQLSRSDIDGTNGFVSLYGALPPGWPGGWKAADNTYVTISTVDDWKAFYSSMFAAGNANFAKAQALKTQLEAATTAAEVAAIVW